MAENQEPKAQEEKPAKLVTVVPKEGVKASSVSFEKKKYYFEKKFDKKGNVISVEAKIPEDLAKQLPTSRYQVK